MSTHTESEKNVNIADYLSFAGIPTFMRLPHSRDLTDVDLVVMGNPFDMGTSNRAGARLGPRALREQSLHVNSFGQVYPWGYSLKEQFRMVDYGDVVGTRPFGAGATMSMVAAMEEACDNVYEAGASPLILGGDHTNPYGPLRAAARKYGKISIIHFDSHRDAYASGEEDHYHHGSFAWDLVKEGVIDDSTSAQLYIRTQTPNEDYQNYSVFYAEEALSLGAEKLAARVRDIVGDNPVYVTFDIDALDPVCAPATGTPVCGGPMTREIRQVLWGLKGLNIIGADLVEVAPPMDTSNQLTSVTGATIAMDLLYLLAATRTR